MHHNNLYKAHEGVKAMKKSKNINYFLFLSFIIAFILFSIVLSFADNSENSKTYDDETKTALITDSSENGEKIAEIQLITPNLVWVIPGEDRLVAEIKIKSYED